jgi:hypothetical protein
VVQLIWFSVPGSLVVAALLFTGWWPDLKSSGAAFLTAGAVPLIGFVIHQVFRIVFEVSFGFEWRGRKVISHIQQHWQNDRLDERKAFLIWESAFYSDQFPASFREHDRGAWHYILSFWSGSVAAVVAAAISIGYSWNAILAFIAMAVVLGAKGFLTWRSLCEQEVQIFRRYRHVFQESRDALMDSAYVPKETREPNHA